MSSSLDSHQCEPKLSEVKYWHFASFFWLLAVTIYSLPIFEHDSKKTNIFILGTHLNTFGLACDLTQRHKNSNGVAIALHHTENGVQVNRWSMSLRINCVSPWKLTGSVPKTLEGGVCKSSIATQVYHIFAIVVAATMNLCIIWLNLQETFYLSFNSNLLFFIVFYSYHYGSPEGTYNFIFVFFQKPR